jgi:hypothetical protein
MILFISNDTLEEKKYQFIKKNITIFYVIDVIYNLNK